MKIDDREVTKLHEAAVAAQKVADDFWNSIDKKDVPLHERPIQKVAAGEWDRLLNWVAQNEEK